MKKFFKIGWVLILLGLINSFAHARPKVVVMPAVRSSNIPLLVAEKRMMELQELIQQKADAYSPEEAKRWLGELSLPKGCETLLCSQKLTRAAKARFVLFTALTNEDDTYGVSMRLYDETRNEFTGEGRAECEFCNAREVKGTVKKVWGELLSALEKPAQPAPEKEPTTLSVLTIPPGAAVFINGERVQGVTPITKNLSAGDYKLKVTLKGHVAAERTVRMAEQSVTLPTIELVRATDLASSDKPIRPNQTSSIYGLSLGMLTIGTVIVGAGGWLTYQDGQVTCEDGRDRKTCPEVYNTKYLGLGAGIVGGALIGSGVALIIKDFLDNRRLKRQSKDAAAEKVSFGFDAATGTATVGLEGGF